MRSQDNSSMSKEQKLRKWVGVGYAAKVAGLGALALIGGARADTPPGTDLALRGNDKTTAPPPYSERAQTRQERAFNPDNVTPEVLKKLGVKNPEQFIRNVQKLEQNLQQREQKREQRQEMRRIVEKARENPEVLESVRKLFEEMPGKKSSETDRRKRDLGRERLTPEKIDPEAWESVRKQLAEVKGQGSTEPEQKSSETSRRKLNVPPNLLCLDVSASHIATEGTVPVTDPPGTGYQAILEPYLTNNCGETITNTEFSITSIVGCPDGSSNLQTRTIAGPASINDGQTLENGISEVENGACIEKTNGVPVATVLPTSFTVQMMALGEDASERTLSSGTSDWKLI